MYAGMSASLGLNSCLGALPSYRKLGHRIVCIVLLFSISWSLKICLLASFACLPAYLSVGKCRRWLALSKLGLCNGLLYMYAHMNTHKHIRTYGCHFQIVSNEPGYYEDGSFGVRIENLLIIKEVPTPFRCWV